MRYYLFIYLLRYLFWFFIFLRQVFIFRAVLLLTLCQCAALRCYISWVCIIIKPSLYILNQRPLLSHVCMSLTHCAFPLLNTVCKLYSNYSTMLSKDFFFLNKSINVSFVSSLWIFLVSPVGSDAEGNGKFIQWPLEGSKSTLIKYKRKKDTKVIYKKKNIFILSTQVFPWHIRVMISPLDAVLSYLAEYMCCLLCLRISVEVRVRSSLQTSQW